MNANEIEVEPSKRRIPMLQKDQDEERNNSRDESPPSDSLSSRLVELSKENGVDVEKPKRGAWLSEQLKEYFAKNGNEDSDPTDDEIVKQIRLPSMNEGSVFQEPIMKWVTFTVEEGEDDHIPSWDKSLLPDEEVVHDLDWKPPTPPSEAVFDFINRFEKEVKDETKINKVLKVGDSLNDALRCLDIEDEVVFEDGFTLMRVKKERLDKRNSGDYMGPRDRRNNFVKRHHGGRGDHSSGRDRRNSSCYQDRRRHGRSRSRSPLRSLGQSSARRDVDKGRRSSDRYGEGGSRRESYDERDRRKRSYSSRPHDDRKRRQEYLERETWMIARDAKVKSEVVMKVESPRSGVALQVFSPTCVVEAKTYKEHREMKTRMSETRK